MAARKAPAVPKGAEVVDGENPTPEHLTTFEEDDDPLSLAGDFVDEEKS